MVLIVKTSVKWVRKTLHTSLAWTDCNSNVNILFVKLSYLLLQIVVIIFLPTLYKQTPPPPQLMSDSLSLSP